MTASPDDQQVVLDALRFGWKIAEYRGRCRPDAPIIVQGSGSNRSEHALPLPEERTPPEQQIQVEAVVSALASKLGVATKPASGSWPTYPW